MVGNQTFLCGWSVIDRECESSVKLRRGSSTFSRCSFQSVVASSNAFRPFLSSGRRMERSASEGGSVVPEFLAGARSGLLRAASVVRGFKAY